MSSRCKTQSFDKIILNFPKFEENFEKHEIKIWRNYEKESFEATLQYVGAAGTALVHSFSLYIVFHSVIFNSVAESQLSSF